MLNWLLDGGGTVSQIAHALELQMPHASLALRQLRERGDVTRDDQQGIRGAPHFITEFGRQRLEQDALSRLKSNHSTAPPQADGIVLGHDGQYALLGYVKPLLSDLIRLPTQGLDEVRYPPSNSKGNSGGCWAVVRSESTRWYDLATLKPTEPPLPTEQGTLTDWSTNAPSISVIHARLLDASEPWTIAPGAWFQTPLHQSDGAEDLQFGNNILGTTPGHSVTIRPPMATHGHLTSKVSRRLAIEAMSEGALVFEDNRQLAHPRTLPLEALWYWLKRKHPRLATSKLELRFQDLCHHFVDENAAAPSISVQRAILMDFGKANWTLGEVLTRINLTGTSAQGGAALLEWFLADTELECTVEWPHLVEPQRALLEELLASMRCRLLLTSNGQMTTLPTAAATLKPANQLGQVKFQLGRGKSFAVNLSEQRAKPRPSAVHDLTPMDAQEMLSALNGDVYDHGMFTHQEVSLEQQKAVWHALSLFPEGDEGWANRNENTSPLAAWIATPHEDRSSRWIRIRNSLPPGWADLLPIESCETSTLIQAMSASSPAWSLKALERIRQRFTHNIESIPRYDHFFNDEQDSIWFASGLLLASQSLPDEFNEMIERACKIWLERPYHSEQVLEAMFPLGLPLNEANQACLLLCLQASENQRKTGALYLWGKALTMIENNEPISPDALRQLMARLPTSWWTAWASDWLKIQLSSSSGRRWLRDQEIPWPALLARPPGERAGLPGLPTTLGGVRPALEDILQIHLVEEGVGKPALLDLHDMIATLERNEPVHYGRLHPLVGWLARPVESWPRIGLEALRTGEEQIGALLYARSFAHRLE